MSTQHMLPNEATTEFMTHCAIQETPAIQAFLGGLTEVQRRRFEEIAHHLVYLGFEDGSTRRSIEPTAAAMERSLVQETTLFLKGAGTLAEERRV